MKNVIKFRFDGKEGYLSVTEKEGKYLTLVQKDTPKIQTTLKTKRLEIAYDIKQPVYVEVAVDICMDPALCEWVFTKLAEENNLYFKVLDDTLCVLEVPTE